ncbi:hypothetical protein AUJ38_01625 [bacterium CG1_02_42_9]|nr:MAG: hypothetical protein AUJ38_01625 [bacterium CG1_02_42_9]
MYHYVENVVDTNDSVRLKLNVTPSEFEAQLETLKKEDYQSFWVKEIPNLTNQRIQLPEKSVVLTFDDGYRDFYEFAFPLLKKYQLKATVFIISDFIDRNDYLTSDQIKDMIDSALIEIGFHTLNHAYLKNTGSETAKKQIFESKANLEKKFNVQILSFAYPYGAFDEQSIKLLKEAGYLAGVSTISNTSQSNKNLFYLSRMRATNYRGVDLAQALDML